jgi:membrane fusion protein, multidrug efflux system
MSINLSANHPRTANPAIGAALTLALAFSLSACGGGAGEGGMGGMPPAAVTYQTVTPQEIAVEQEFVAQANGSREVEIRARVNGIVEKRLYNEGSVVKAGTPLFRLDSSTYAAAVAQAEAALATADANLKQAEREYSRLKPLIDAKAISQKEWDSAASALDVARAQQKQAQAQLASARVDLGYTHIVAPISGSIGRALKVEGALANAASDSLLATMAQTDPIYVNFSLTENERNSAQAEIASGALKLPPGGYVVRVKTSEGQALKPLGKLNFTDYKADANTGTYAARAEFPNADGALAPGQFVRVVLTGAKRPAAIVVPQRAVLDGPTGKYVYLVGKDKDGKPIADMRPVVPGEWVALDGKEKNGWIITHGLKAGDPVIIDGMARIFGPGQALAPMTPEEAARQAQPPAPGSGPAKTGDKAADQAAPKK